MSITNKLNQIKNAIYGKDVRGAIHDAIKQVYDDASVNHDNANMEVKMARGTHNTLNDRLDNVDEIQAQTSAQLSQKINHGEGGVITNAMLSQEVREAMTGGSVAVVGKNAVLRENIALGQVTREKTSFYRYSLDGNLVNDISVTVGRGYHSDGTLNETGTKSMITIYNDNLDFVSGAIRLVHDRLCDFAFWGEQNEYISGYYYEHVSTGYPTAMKNIPVTAHHVTITFDTSVLDEIVICKEENYRAWLKPLYFDDQLQVKMERVIGDISLTKMSELQMYPNGNLITKLNTEKGYFYSATGEYTKSVDDYTVTIDLEPNQVYKFNFDTVFTFWDGTGVFISGGPWGSLSGTTNTADFKPNENIPSNATQLRMVVFKGDIQRAVLAKTEYFTPELKPQYIIEGLVGSNTDETKQSISPLSGKSVVFLGDSWCAGNAESNGNWATLIKSNNPTMTITNYGMHGADWAQCSIHVLDHSDKMDILKTSDYIIIEAYTNGLYDEVSALSKPLGEVDEFTYHTLEEIESFPDTYAKDMERALYRIATECNGKKIGVIFPYKAVAHLSPTNAFRVFRPQVLACCRKYNIPVFDNFDGCNIPSWHTELRKEYYVKNDIVHLNAKGYDVITPSIENWMKSL